MEKYIIKLKNKVLREKEISYEEALNLISLDTNNKNDILWEEKQIYVR